MFVLLVVPHGKNSPFHRQGKKSLLPQFLTVSIMNSTRNWKKKYSGLFKCVMLVPDGRQKCLPDPWLSPPNLRTESPMSNPRHGNLDHSHGLLVRGSEDVKEPLPELPSQTPGSASVSSAVCRKSQLLLPALIHFLLCSKQPPSKKLQCWSLLTLRNNLYI